MSSKATAGGALNIWSSSTLTNLKLGIRKGSKASLRPSPDVTTPEGQPCLEVEIKRLQPDAAPERR
ncbi:MAG: hypothetical protein WCS31_06295 [Verrucomicrobiae bacterium]